MLPVRARWALVWILVAGTLGISGCTTPPETPLGPAVPGAEVGLGAGPEPRDARVADRAAIEGTLRAAPESPGTAERGQANTARPDPTSGPTATDDASSAGSPAPVTPSVPEGAASTPLIDPVAREISRLGSAEQDRATAGSRLGRAETATPRPVGSPSRLATQTEEPSAEGPSDDDPRERTATADRATRAGDAPAPYFTFDRPFAPQEDVPASAYYPYGTDGRGTLLLHHGQDFGVASGTPVLSVGEGRVVYAGSDRATRFGPTTDFYGNLVLIVHPRRTEDRSIYSLYGHLSEIDAQRGESVQRGQVIGRVGGTGIAMGPHLHLEFRTASRDYGATLNPALLLAPASGRGAIVGRVVDSEGMHVSGVTVGLFGDASVGGRQWTGEVQTYLEGEVNHAPTWDENFVFFDVEPGDYVLELTQRAGPSAPVTVAAGRIAEVTLQIGDSFGPEGSPPPDASSEPSANSTGDVADPS